MAEHSWISYPVYLRKCLLNRILQERSAYMRCVAYTVAVMLILTVMMPSSSQADTEKSEYRAVCKSTVQVESGQTKNARCGHSHLYGFALKSILTGNWMIGFQLFTHTPDPPDSPAMTAIPPDDLPKCIYPDYDEDGWDDLKDGGALRNAAKGD